MNDLWIVGYAGATLALALGWPLLGLPQGTGSVMAVPHRMLGVLFLLGALATALIATNHGQLVSPGIAISLDHIVSAGDLVFWSLLTVWMQRATRVRTKTSTTVAIVAVPLGFYAVLVTIFDGPPRFAWLLPMSVAGAAYAIARSIHSGSHRRCSIDDRLVSRLAVFAAALCTAQAIRTFWPHIAPLREIVPLTMTAGFLSIASLAMRGLFSERDEMAEADTMARKPYARSALNSDAAGKLLCALDNRMKHDRLYVDPHLTLATLAHEMHTTSHAISQALNQVDGRSLNEYLAAWRVAEARRLLLDPASAVITIDAVAEHAGFGSRSAFYKAFKAKEGMTPTEFRKRHAPRM